MQAKKQLRKPENWDDFESLCKKLWGEIWQCPEIKRNGKRGQRQNGVDLYGLPSGQTGYFGIQCKGKDDYTNRKLTKQEIDKEALNAQGFTPPLKKLYFATTADKDVKTEAYIRQVNIENIQKGLFEVHLFSWQDIVDLIDENKDTHDWYVKSQNFKINSAVTISFENDDTKLFCEVPMARKYTRYKQRIIPSNSPFGFDFVSLDSNENFFTQGDNLTYARFRIKIANIGSSSLVDSKLIVSIEGSYRDLEDENVDIYSVHHVVQTDLAIHKEKQVFELVPKRRTIVPQEQYLSHPIFLKPNIDGSTLKLKWRFISQNHTADGVMNLVVNTIEKRVDRQKFVSLKIEEKVVEEIGDYFASYDDPN